MYDMESIVRADSLWYTSTLLLLTSDNFEDTREEIDSRDLSRRPRATIRDETRDFSRSNYISSGKIHEIFRTSRFNHGM